MLALAAMLGSATPTAVPVPTAAQLQYQRDEIGVIIHYNMATG